MIAHLAHPNLAGAFVAEEIAPIGALKFFEVHNGIRGIESQGPVLERVWDVILTKRLTELSLAPVFGLAVDDAHDYQDSSRDQAQPGRAWIMVRARKLTPESLIKAMEAGDFYASTGVLLRRLERSGKEIAVEVETDRDATYTIQFVGTRRGYPTESQPVVDAAGKPLRATRRYSDALGTVLKEVKGPSATYTLQGDEIYVRAKVISSKIRENQPETAWIQPVTPVATARPR